MTPWRTPAAVSNYPYRPLTLGRRPPPSGHLRPAAEAARGAGEVGATPDPRPAVRRMRWDDIPTVLNIADGPPDPRWIRPDFLHVFQSNETMGYVAVVGRRVVGFALCSVARLPGPANSGGATFFSKLRSWLRGGRRCLELFGLAVRSDGARAETERALLEEIIRDFRESPDRIQAVAPETRLWAQILLRDAGFRAIRIFRCYYGNEDGYLMRREGRAPAA